MSGFFDNLYRKFLLRDILAKAVPGFLLLAYLFHDKIPANYPKHGFPEIVVVAVLYGLSFMTGMLLQFLGSQFRIIKIYVHEGDRNKSLKYLREFLGDKDNKENLSTQRERFVILKNMSGTYAMALIAIILVTFFKNLEIELILAIGLVAALIWENRFHAGEQAEWENPAEAE